MDDQNAAQAARWNGRYGADGFLFGEAPSQFVVAQADLLPQGATVLCPCDGEGRNAVWLAAQGHTVTTFDISPVGVEKARAWAAKNEVQVTSHIASYTDWDWSQTFDAVVAVFIQFIGPAERKGMFQGLAEAVRPGGLLMLHGYAPRQVQNGTGGPSAVENMYTEDLLTDAFAGWDVLRIADYDADLAEGPGHAGRSALIDFVARKPG